MQNLSIVTLQYCNNQLESNIKKGRKVTVEIVPIMLIFEQTPRLIVALYQL